MRINHNVNRLKVGDKITTDFFEGEETVVRTITHLFDDVRTGTGRGVLFDSGEECPCCHKYFGTSVIDNPKFLLTNNFVDAGWAIPVNE